MYVSFYFRIIVIHLISLQCHCNTWLTCAHLVCTRFYVRTMVKNTPLQVHGYSLGLTKCCNTQKLTRTAKMTTRIGWQIWNLSRRHEASPECTMSQTTSPERTMAQTISLECTMVQTTSPECPMVQTTSPECTMVQTSYLFMVCILARISKAGTNKMCYRHLSEHKLLTLQMFTTITLVI